MIDSVGIRIELRKVVGRPGHFSNSVPRSATRRPGCVRPTRVGLLRHKDSRARPSATALARRRRRTWLRLRRRTGRTGPGRKARGPGSRQSAHRAPRLLVPPCAAGPVGGPVTAYRRLGPCSARRWVWTPAPDLPGSTRRSCRAMQAWKPSLRGRAHQPWGRSSPPPSATTRSALGTRQRGCHDHWTGILAA